MQQEHGQLIQTLVQKLTDADTNTEIALTMQGLLQQMQQIEKRITTARP
jgi:hypothetical protein